MGENVPGVGCDCKVGRTIDAYGLEGLNRELRRRRDEGASLRDLATYTNRRVLAAVLDAATDGDSEGAVGPFGAFESEAAVAAVYEALADDDAPAERRARVRTHLERVGVDVDTIEWARSRCVGVVERTLERLGTADALVDRSGAFDSAVRITREQCHHCFPLVPMERSPLGSVGGARGAVDGSVRATEKSRRGDAQYCCWGCCS